MRCRCGRRHRRHAHLIGAAHRRCLRTDRRLRCRCRVGRIRVGAVRDWRIFGCRRMLRRIGIGVRHRGCRNRRRGRGCRARCCWRGGSRRISGRAWRGRNRSASKQGKSHRCTANRRNKLHRKAPRCPFAADRERLSEVQTSAKACRSGNSWNAAISPQTVPAQRGVCPKVHSQHNRELVGIHTSLAAAPTRP